MNQLPLEVIAHIGTLLDSHSLCQLCVACRPLCAIVTPILYREVCLTSTAAVEQFNSALKSSPSLGRLIHGIVLEDPAFATLAKNAYFAELEDRHTLQVWSTLIRRMASISRSHNLEYVAMSREVCRRLEWNFDRDADLSLGQVLLDHRIILDHLVVCHTPLNFFVKRVHVRKLTWYACTGQIDFESSMLRLIGDHDEDDSRDDDDSRESMPRESNVTSKHLQEVHYLIGDASDQHSLAGASHAQEPEETQHRWISGLLNQCDALSSSQVTPIKFSMSLHVQTPDARARLERELCNGGRGLMVDSWGRAYDVGQRDAEVKSFDDREWLGDTSTCAGEDIKADVSPKDGSGLPWCACHYVGPAKDVLSCESPGGNAVNRGGRGMDCRESWYVTKVAVAAGKSIFRQIGYHNDMYYY